MIWGRGKPLLVCAAIVATASLASALVGGDVWHKVRVALDPGPGYAEAQPGDTVRWSIMTAGPTAYVDGRLERIVRWTNLNRVPHAGNKHDSACAQARVVRREGSAVVLEYAGPC